LVRAAPRTLFEQAGEVEGADADLFREHVQTHVDVEVGFDVLEDSPQPGGRQSAPRNALKFGGRAMAHKLHRERGAHQLPVQRAAPAASLQIRLQEPAQRGDLRIRQIQLRPQLGAPAACCFLHSLSKYRLIEIQNPLRRGSPPNAVNVEPETLRLERHAPRPVHDPVGMPVGSPLAHQRHTFNEMENIRGRFSVTSLVHLAGGVALEKQALPSCAGGARHHRTLEHNRFAPPASDCLDSADGVIRRHSPSRVRV